MKKLIALAAAAGAILLVVRKNRASKKEADLWREATAPNSSTQKN